MDAILSKKNMQEVFDEIIREVTEKVAGIRLYQEDSLLKEDLCTVYTAFNRGFQFNLSLCADLTMFTRLTQNMLQAEEVMPQDVEDFTKEYFNVLCGYIASRLFQTTKIASRFSVPIFCSGRYLPDDLREQFIISYSSDKNESAQLIHYAQCAE